MSSRYDPRWWEGENPQEDGHKKVIPIVRALDESLRSSKQRMARCARLYDPEVQFIGIEMDVSTGPYPSPLDRRGPVTMNIVKSAIDTVTSMIAKNQPRATFMTDGADYTTSMMAEDLERFIEAEFQRSQVYDDTTRMFYDAAQVGLGALRIEDDDGQPCVERVTWDALVIDPLEFKSGVLRQMHQLRFVDRDVLKEMFPAHRDAIDLAASDDKVRYWTSYRRLEADLIPVIESWHLPSGKRAKDGVHCWTMDGVTLLWEKYKKDYFPFVIYRWAERHGDFFGMGLAEELAGIQNKINKINWHITRCHDLSNSYVLVQAVDASLKIKATGGSDPLQLLPYRGQAKPEFITPPAVQPELYSHLIFLIQQAYKIAGISELSAASQKPAGLESAIALQTYSDIETQRFSIQAQRYERCVMEVARMIVRCMEDIGNDDYEAKWRSSNLIKTIRWGEVKLDENMYVMSVEPASVQSRTPSGRLQAAIELGNSGLLSKDDLLRIIGHPDLNRSLTLANASIDHAEAIVEKLSRGGYDPPEVLDNLPVAIKYVSQAYMTMKDKRAPEYILDGFRNWLTAAQREMTKTVPEASPMPLPPEAVPPAGPQAAPPGAPGGMPALDIPPGVLA